MKINQINKYNINTFRSNNQTTAPRSQQLQNSVNCEREQMLAQKADSMSANPLTSLGYKLYRTFRFLSEHESTPVQQNFNAVA